MQETKFFFYLFGIIRWECFQLPSSLRALCSVCTGNCRNTLCSFRYNPLSRQIFLSAADPLAPRNILRNIGLSVLESLPAASLFLNPLSLTIGSLDRRRRRIAFRISSSKLTLIGLKTLPMPSRSLKGSKRK